MALSKMKILALAAMVALTAAAIFIVVNDDNSADAATVNDYKSEAILWVLGNCDGDIDIDAKEPATVKIVDEAGSEVFAKTADKFHEENIPLKLAKGRYWLKLSHGTGGFEVKCELD